MALGELGATCRHVTAERPRSHPGGDAEWTSEYRPELENAPELQIIIWKSSDYRPPKQRGSLKERRDLKTEGCLKASGGWEELQR